MLAVLEGAVERELEEGPRLLGRRALTSIAFVFQPRTSSSGRMEGLGKIEAALQPVAACSVFPDEEVRGAEPEKQETEIGIRLVVRDHP